jgi:hypothetical protein
MSAFHISVTHIKFGAVGIEQKKAIKTKAYRINGRLIFYGGDAGNRVHRTTMTQKPPEFTDNINSVQICYTTKVCK